MFAKLESEITFSDIKAFCEEFSEGVRVEYKREIQHIPKIISSFANSSGGIFMIGAETDENNRVKFPIQGIPNRNGIPEQIQQSALTGIYPAVIPEVMIKKIPNTDNVVVIIRVEESPQAPHAIQNSTRVYVRIGSITQPYDEPQLAQIDLIEHMFKRREDSQTVTRQILKRTEERANPLFAANQTTLTVIIHPVFPYQPIIATGEIYKFATENQLVGSYSSRVTGGVAGGFSPSTRRGGYTGHYWELNEHGIVYGKIVLGRNKSTTKDHNGQSLVGLRFVDLVQQIGELINRSQSFFKKSQYFGHVEVTAQLKQVGNLTLMYSESQHLQDIESRRNIDSEISASTQFLPRDLEIQDKFIDTVDRLTSQLLWAFNDDNPTQRRELIKRFYSSS